MEINITSLLSAPAFVPFDLSNNRATLGENAGTLTWGASVECAGDSETPLLLDTEEKRQAFREFVRDSGGWTAEEIAAWDSTELYALFLQWVAADLREAFGDLPPDQWDWADYERRAERGSISSRLFKSGSEIYFDIGN